MPILYIHGVATRNRDSFFAMQPYLRRLVAPEISSAPEGVLIDDVSGAMWPPPSPGTVPRGQRADCSAWGRRRRHSPRLRARSPLPRLPTRSHGSQRLRLQRQAPGG
jgi:hypothetical protein